MRLNKIFNPENFLIVHHRALNNNAPNLDELAEKTYALEKNISGRKAIMALEGDIIEYKDDIYFCHDILKRELKWFSEAKNSRESIPSVEAYMKMQKAAYMEETLDHIAKNNPQTHLVIELKSKITGKGMEKIIDGLKTRGLESYHYDSFFGRSLEIAHSADDNAIISKHLFSNIGSINIPIPLISHTGFKPEILTIPYMFSIGKVPKNTIYGLVKSRQDLKKVSEDTDVLGAYATFD